MSWIRNQTSDTPISVIIPSYRNPDYLDLCLQSATSNQMYNNNQIIVILDGFAEESEHVVSKYKGIDIINFPENMGQTRAHNIGVTLATNEAILIVNDDNVFPLNWDMRLSNVYDEMKVISPNQIEPSPSIFKSFVIRNLGTTPTTFQSEKFEAFQSDLETSINRPELFTNDGQTWPVFMSKKWYQILNGIDPYFPSPAVADHDFFLRCELAGLKCARYNGCHFYHFSGAGTKRDEEQTRNHMRSEEASHVHFNWKWGFYSSFDENNSHMPHNTIINGIKYE